MSIDLPDLNAIRRLRRGDLGIQAIVESIVADDPEQQEMVWDSIKDIRYDLVYSFQNPPGPPWTLDSTFTGTGGRMSVIRNINKNEPKRIWQIVSHVGEGSEPKVRAIVNFDGSGVYLEWNFLGAPVSGSPKFRVHRNGQLLATLAATTLAYLDTAVASGQRYTYEVKYFAN